MALSARTPSTYKTNLFIPAVYTAEVIRAVKNKLVCWDAIWTEWRDNMKKGDTFYLPKTNTVVAEEVVVGSDPTARNPFNTTGVTLAINQWYQSEVTIDTMSLRQTQIDPDTESAQEVAYAVAKQMDTSVNTLFSALNGSTVIGADAQTFTEDLALQIVETLDEADVPPEDRTWIIDPSVKIDMLKIDKVLSQEYATKGGVVSGEIGHSMWGGAVRVTNNLTAATTGAYACLLHKKAIAGKAQIDKEAWKDETLGRRKHEVYYHAEALWGVIEAQDTFGIPFYTRKA